MIFSETRLPKVGEGAGIWWLDPDRSDIWRAADIITLVILVMVATRSAPLSMQEWPTRFMLSVYWLNKIWNGYYNESR